MVHLASHTLLLLIWVEGVDRNTQFFNWKNNDLLDQWQISKYSNWSLDGWSIFHIRYWKWKETQYYMFISAHTKRSCSTRVKELLFCIITYGGGVVDELGQGNSVGYFGCYFWQIKTCAHNVCMQGVTFGIKQLMLLVCWLYVYIYIARLLQLWWNFCPYCCLCDVVTGLHCKPHTKVN